MFTAKLLHLPEPAVWQRLMPRNTWIISKHYSGLSLYRGNPALTALLSLQLTNITCAAALNQQSPFPYWECLNCLISKALDSKAMTITSDKIPISAPSCSQFPTKNSDFLDYLRQLIFWRIAFNKEVHIDVPRPRKVKGSAPLYLRKYKGMCAV